MSNRSVCYVLTGTIFTICLLGFLSFFFYLVGVHYPFSEGVKVQKASPGWTKGEKTTFITLFTLGGCFFILMACRYRSESQSTPAAVDESRSRLMELNEILYVDKKFNFPELKNEVLKLKSNELEPQLRTSQTQLTRLITELKDKVNNDAKTIIDLYLQAHAQMIAQKKENDTFAQSQLTNFEDVLQNHLTQEELRTLLTQQKDTLALDQRLNNLNKLQGRTR